MRVLETMHQDPLIKYLKTAETPVAVRAEFTAGDYYTKGNVFFTFFASDENGRLLVRLRVPFGFNHAARSITVDGERVPWDQAVAEGATLRGVERVTEWHEELWCVVTFVVEMIKRRVAEIIEKAGVEAEFLEDSEWKWICGGEGK